MKKHFLLLTLLLLCLQTGFSQNRPTKGVDFWLGFHENILNPEISVAISSSRSTSGTISIPLGSWSQNFTVSADSVVEITIPLMAAMASESEVREPKGIHITSNDTISIVALNTASHSTDATNVLPSNLLGKDYYILSYEKVFGSEVSQFLIAAKDSNTLVQVTPTADTRGGNLATIPFSFLMQPGQVYQVQSDSGNLNGTHVTSTQDIAVFGGHQCAIVGATYWCDHMYEQMHPVSNWGMSFISTPLKTRLNGDRYIIMAARDTTLVKIEGVPAFRLNAGQSSERIISDPSTIISNKPISIALISNSQGYDMVSDSDPFLLMLPPLDQVAYQSIFKTFTVNSITTHYVNVLAKTSTIGQVKLDGLPISPTDIINIPLSDYSYAALTIPEGTHMLESDSGYIAYSYGYGNAEGYGFVIGDIDLSTLVATQEIDGLDNFKLYPNPTRNSAILAFDNPKREAHHLNLYDAQGQLVQQITEITASQVMLRKNNLPAGFYFFELLNFENKPHAVGRLVIE